MLFGGVYFQTAPTLLNYSIFHSYRIHVCLLKIYLAGKSFIDFNKNSSMKIECKRSGECRCTSNSRMSSDIYLKLSMWKKFESKQSQGINFYACAMKGFTCRLAITNENFTENKKSHWFQVSASKLLNQVT